MIPAERRPVVYETRVPGTFVLDDGAVVRLSSRDVEALAREPLFLLYVPPTRATADEVYWYLRSRGFEDAFPSFPKGEKYSVRKVLDYPWELHVRIYINGFLWSEVEIQRDYLEHLSDRRVYVVYEVYECLAGLCEPCLLYRPANRWVLRILDDIEVRLSPPSSLLPWKYIAVAALAAGLYASAKLLSEGSLED